MIQYIDNVLEFVTATKNLTRKPATILCGNNRDGLHPGGLITGIFFSVRFCFQVDGPITGWAYKRRGWWGQVLTGILQFYSISKFKFTLIFKLSTRILGWDLQPYRLCLEINN